jgi:hypothetical protein
MTPKYAQSLYTCKAWTTSASNPAKIDWLLTELNTSEPHRLRPWPPIALRYSHKDIAKAFQRL